MNFPRPTVARRLESTILFGAVLPAVLLGTWVPERVGGCSTWPGVSGIVFSSTSTTLSHSGAGKCELSSVSAKSATRWYVDFDCGTTPVQLDINRIGDDRLLVAERPLGEAEIYVRCS